MDSLNWEELEIGETYQFEDKYHIQADEVVILNKEYQEDGNYIRIQIEMTKPRHG